MMPGPVVLYGSSTFTLWTERMIKESFSGLDIINRGFGGSTSEEALDNYRTLVKPLEPSVIVYYEGTNDIARGQRPEESFGNTLSIFEMSKDDNPYIVWIFLLLHKCPSFAEHHNDFDKLNEMYTDFCSKNERCFYVDANDALVDFDVIVDAYMDDGIHFNEKAYGKLGILMNKKLEETKSWI